MARAMLEYTKEVLFKIRFDVSLFCKEVKKATQRLLPHEIEELREFVMGLIQEDPRLRACLVYMVPQPLTQRSP